MSGFVRFKPLQQIGRYEQTCTHLKSDQVTTWTTNKGSRSNIRFYKVLRSTKKMEAKKHSKQLLKCKRIKKRRGRARQTLGKLQRGSIFNFTRIKICLRVRSLQNRVFNFFTIPTPPWKSYKCRPKNSTTESLAALNLYPSLYPWIFINFFIIYIQQVI